MCGSATLRAAVLPKDNLAAHSTPHVAKPVTHPLSVLGFDHHFLLAVVNRGVLSDNDPLHVFKNTRPITPLVESTATRNKRAQVPLDIRELTYIWIGRC